MTLAEFTRDQLEARVIELEQEITRLHELVQRQMIQLAEMQIKEQKRERK